MTGVFWRFVLAHVDPRQLKELVAEAGVSVQHLDIAWPDFGDGPLGIASLRVWTLTGGDFPVVVEVASQHALPIEERDFAQRLSTAMNTEVLVSGGTPNYAWMVLVSPNEHPRRVCVNIGYLDRDEYVIHPDPYPEQGED